MYTDLIEVISGKSLISQKGITFIESSNRQTFLSYKELFSSSLKILSYFQEKGLNPKDELVFQIDDNKAFIVVFWACILGGIIPVPLTVGRNDDHRNKLFNVWEILNNPALIISTDNAKRLERFLHSTDKKDLFTLNKNRVLDIEEIYKTEQKGEIYNSKADDIAYIQFSSGSTGSPKGVVLTHKNLITNMMGISEASEYTKEDSKMSWMPLTHDMGLIGFHLTPLFVGMNQYILPTNLFIRRPLLWLDKASEHKATILCSPNFGYKYLLKQYNQDKDYNWDLSSVRMIYNGAEPISEEICHEFIGALEIRGLKRTAMYPVYGLAEASLAVSFSNLEDEVGSIYLDRSELQLGSKIKELSKKEGAVSFVNVGNAIPFCSIKILDKKNIECDEDVIGHVKIKGDNVTAGYYNNYKETDKVICKEGWLDTGDLGFLHQGDLYITGRSKDIIFINGQNYYPHDIERSLEVIDKIELGKVVVAGHTSTKTGEEEVVVFILHKAKLEPFLELIQQIKQHINQSFGFEPDYIVPIREVPKTTSGKVQRFKLIDNYISGFYDEVIREIDVVSDSINDKKGIVDPSNDIEKKLTSIWSDILKRKNFGVTEKFFDIGGNSLKGAQIITSIHKEFNVDLDFSILYEKQSIAEIAKLIQAASKNQYHKIPVVQENDIYPLSPNQKRLYYLWEVNKDFIAYNVPFAFSLKGKVNIVALEKSIQKVISKHEIFRSVFFVENEEPKQRFHSNNDFTLQVNNLIERNVNVELQKRVKPFDLKSSQLYRIELLKQSKDSFILFFDFHHIIMDGVSASLMVKEILHLYSNSDEVNLEVQYKDFVCWENKKRDSDNYQDQENFWRNQFRGELPLLNLPLDYPRPSLMEYEGKKIEVKLGKVLSDRIQGFAKKEHTSAFILLLASFNILLSKYSGQEDVVVGVPVAGRNHSQLHNLLGMFVNNVPIRTFPDGGISFQEYLRKVKDVALKSISNQNYPFEDLVKLVEQKRDISRNSIFDCMFNYQNMSLNEVSCSDFTCTQLFFDPGFSKYDISLEVFDREDELTLFFEYSTALFADETIDKLSKGYQALLLNIINSPDKEISELSINSQEEFQKLVFDFNETKKEYPADKVVHKLFDKQVEWGPGALAVLRNEISSSPGLINNLTYKELQQRSNQFANLLRKNGVVHNIPVAIILDRTPELLVAIFGVLKAGGCYVPIDKNYPVNRIEYILNDCRCNIAITDSVNELEDSELLVKVINIEEKDLYCNEDLVIQNISSSENLAYIIYTSGTTDNPKGVMINHKSLINYINFAKDTYVRKEKVILPLYTSISFDLTVTSIFSPILSGNTIITYAESEIILPLEDVINDNQANVIKATPSHLKMIKEFKFIKDDQNISSISRIIVGGEALTTQLANEINGLFNNQIEIYNEYGPTEATVGCMIYQFNKDADNRPQVPIGKPVDNTQIYLLDKYLKPVPLGVVGEMYISGDCLARGYVFNPTLTDKKFVQNPFLPDQKMYKTGDLARMLPDGNIEYISRSDQQVKINGYRIELEEIEQQILTNRDISKVAVAVKGESLCAYLVLNKSEESVLSNVSSDQLIDDVRNHLISVLPSYMVPKHYLILDSLPLTRNGKIDYSELPTPSINEEEKKSATNDIQEIMVAVWRDVLNHEKIGVTDNFFELGGDSIKAVQIASRLFDQDISVNVKDILTDQTIEQLSLHAEIADETIQYEQGIVEGEVDLNPIQRWFFEQDFVNPHFYNQSVLLEFKKPINKDVLQKTFKILIEHHDGLRMNYNSEKKVMFYNNEHLDREFIVEEYAIKLQAANHKLQKQQDDKGAGEKKNCKESESDNSSTVFNSLCITRKDFNIEDICNNIRGSFDLNQTLLIKAAIIKDDNSEFLFITTHHLIIDGVSWRILMEDFYNIYTSLENDQDIKLLKKTASLSDWDKKMSDFTNSQEVNRQTEYWKNNLQASGSGLLIQEPQLQSSQTKDIQNVSFQITEKETQFLLTDANKPFNTNIEILLVTALLRSLKDRENVDYITIEMENHGRYFEDIDAARTIGWFTAMFPVKFVLNQESISEQIKYIKEQIRKVPNNGMGYGVLNSFTKAVKPTNKISEIRFNYLGQFDSELNNNLFYYSFKDTGSEIDQKNNATSQIEMNCMIMAGQLHVEINYNSKIFKRETMDWLTENYLKHLNVICQHIQNEQEIHFTSSDFDAVELNDDDLNILFG